jgi:2-C-methyl-D-erythritol 4-phosphate cytidylyltransferase/2-C-methyl-D-erythritol 2,4-cyclodiphosphate synthase
MSGKDSIPKIFILIPAGGSGTRFGGGQRKQYLDLSGVNVLTKTLEAFQDVPGLQQIIISLPAEDLKKFASQNHLPNVNCVAGGNSRAESVHNAFAAITQASDDDIILIHDAVRPLLTKNLIQRVIQAAQAQGAAIPVLPVTDTIKEVDAGAIVTRTLQRADLRSVQTPQGFRYGILKSVYGRVNFRDPAMTDEAMLLESQGVRVATIDGDKDNIKITVAADYERVKALLGGGMKFRIGTGYDVHRLVEGRKCVIGGVTFDHSKGPLGHSDADVLLHAICDALLGAANLGDLGELFPDNDPKFKNADSSELLSVCYNKVREKGWRVNNLDTIIVCEKPKIKPRREEVRNLIANLLDIDKDCVSVKATTEEKMGFTGSEEGISAWAYVSLVSP